MFDGLLGLAILVAIFAFVFAFVVSYNVNYLNNDLNKNFDLIQSRTLNLTAKLPFLTTLDNEQRRQFTKQVTPMLNLVTKARLIKEEMDKMKWFFSPSLSTRVTHIRPPWRRRQTTGDN